ncbi:hypothetical protein ACQP1W_44345 [Spirillospora sp. CA-255316]
MVRNVLAYAFLAVAAAVAIVLVLVADVPLAVVLSLGAGALGLLWLVVLLVVPWHVYFQARRLLQEIGTSRARGLEVPPERETEARRIAARARTAAVGGHVVSAAAVAVVTYFSGTAIGYYFAGFYLLSTAFRPAHAWFAHLRRRLRTMLHEVRYPRDDVLDLLERLNFLEGHVEAMRLTTEHLHQADHTLERRLEAVDLAVQRGAAELNGRLDALGRRFEATVAQLTDDQELITGIRAFLRLLRADPA